MATASLMFYGMTTLHELQKAADLAVTYGFPPGAPVDSITAGVSGARFSVSTELRLLPGPDLWGAEVEGGDES